MKRKTAVQIALEPNKRGVINKGNTQHGQRHTRTYTSWRHMKIRCLVKTNHDYPKYGGSGIKICEEWLDFNNFYKDMGDRPEGTTLDRIDNAKGYFKENCRWASYRVQTTNRGKTSGLPPGVTRTKDKYQARIFINKKLVHLGTFPTVNEAAITYWIAKQIDEHHAA